MNQPLPAYAVLSNLDAVNNLAEAISKWAADKGFWQQAVEPSHPNVEKVQRMKKFEKIALMHSELSEMLEGLRQGVMQALPEGITNEEEELADLIIRALDYAGHYKLRIGQAIGVKMAKNEGRPFMHGKLA
jgi:hypothetical protein